MKQLNELLSSYKEQFEKNAEEIKKIDEEIQGLVRKKEEIVGINLQLKGGYNALLSLTQEEVAEEVSEEIASEE